MVPLSVACYLLNMVMVSACDVRLSLSVLSVAENEVPLVN